jgi:hypothetical protein
VVTDCDGAVNVKVAVVFVFVETVRLVGVLGTYNVVVVTEVVPDVPSELVADNEMTYNVFSAKLVIS